MRHRLLITASISFCLALLATTAQAQIASSCLRPLGIPDKWVENQTPPWDSTDTFDPTGANPDVYLTGFDPITDQGLPIALTLYNRLDPPQGGSAWAVQVSEPGGGPFQDAIVTCSGYFHALGESFPSVTGNVAGPFGAGMLDLISQDPAASWDPSANGGRGGVVNSAFAQSPRIIALPVFAPDAYAKSTSTSPAMVKIVGFFVSERTIGAVHGYLTGWSQLTVPPVTARVGEWAQLSATFSGPGSPLAGLTVEFLFNDAVVATAQTDGTGTARPATTAFNPASKPGEYPGAIRVRLLEWESFFVADEAAGDLTILRKLPVITWPTPADITYGTPLGPQHLNATADVPGQFSYTPAAGTVLPVSKDVPKSLTVTYVPHDTELYEDTTATTFVNVRPAPLLLTIKDAQKFYLDPLPAFTFTVAGLLNGDTVEDQFGRTTLETTATAASAVGTYPITMGGTIDAENYFVTLNSGVLTIVPRPTAAVIQSVTPSPSTYSQAVTFAVGVSSSVGVPGGTVTLLRGDVPVASGALVNGQASLSVSSLFAGSHALTALYAGAGGFAASSSPVVVHSVNRANTTTRLTSSVNPARTGQAVTFTATVSPVAPAAGAPTGSVEFLRGSVVVATLPLTNGSAQLTISTLAAGKHAIQARYAGTANYASSLSAVLQQTVKGGGK